MNYEEEKKKILKYYDEITNDPCSRYRRIEELLPRLNKSQIILDYGCGTGFMSHLFAQKFGCNIEAVDICEEEIEKAR